MQGVSLNRWLLGQPRPLPAGSLESTWNMPRLSAQLRGEEAGLLDYQLPFAIPQRSPPGDLDALAPLSRVCKDSSQVKSCPEWDAKGVCMDGRGHGLSAAEHILPF